MFRHFPGILVIVLRCLLNVFFLLVLLFRRVLLVRRFLFLRLSFHFIARLTARFSVFRPFVSPLICAHPARLPSRPVCLFTTHPISAALNHTLLVSLSVTLPHSTVQRSASLFFAGYLRTEFAIAFLVFWLKIDHLQVHNNIFLYLELHHLSFMCLHFILVN